MDVSWIHGSAGEPAIQVHTYDPRTFILRQSMAVDYEGPFLFLLLGDDRAVLIDTGATESAELFPLRQVVDELVGSLELLVLHTHGHGDHVAADSQFAGRPGTRVIDAGLESVREFFGFTDGTALLDLGGRVLECLATPGHHEAAVTFYDPRTGFLLTGDTVYPGRLYVEDWAAFTASIDRLIAFAETRPVSHVLGCHVEMTREPGVDYPIYTVHQPDEPPLQMTVAQLRDVRKAIEEVGDRGGRHVFDDFIICREDVA